MLLSIMGPAGSGKSTLAKHLQERRPDLVARVPVDFFFVPRREDETVSDYLARPFGYDWAALDAALDTHRSSPDCDFVAFRWISPTGGLPIAEAPVYVLDGMRPHPRSDLLVQLRLDAVTQRDRLRERDVRWGTAVAGRTEHLHATYQAGVGELPRTPDLTLDATAPLEQNGEHILRLLASCR
ncbi:MAG TPA: hypothetical protein VHC49_23855 [Mycobacteriales bacterium]|nr:hypothetical protein [Mycobacteriales bacterium]